jgi:hypothetical protein
MKITIENGDKCTVESDAVIFGELVELFKQCAIGVGFHPDTVKEYFDN